MLFHKQRVVKIAGEFVYLKIGKVGEKINPFNPVSRTLFNVHVDDLEGCIPSYLDINTHKYADDCTQDEVIPYGSTSNMQEVLDTMNDWTLRNKVKLNAKKTKDMWICFKAAIPEPPSLKIGDDTIERVNSFKLLCLWINDTLKWNTHIEEITKKVNKRLFYLRECRRANLPTKVGLTCYKTKLRPVLEYAAPIWGGLPQYLTDELERTLRTWYTFSDYRKLQLEPRSP
ncbi:RNA-directed DNA polymerase from mobile element jockey [Paramuricea clavata]|uniref:RNA-directed DNA polymerase from mobile element jockey n=1 Tax=Paramuricea clavata TaxID=317549 RepID=A0A7D9DAR8_PARCT|nr:RNA-directed DNA polymerase from mobile element jockey [Paramuricea clavata]